MIEPKILKGTRDFGPEEMSKRLYVINQIRSVFARFGYAPIETPAIEYAQTILGKYGDEGDQLTYTFKDHGGRAIALRYDQTVPTARFVAANQGTLTFPFKRYQIGPVWRADKPQRGRYREFYQCDIDIIGTTSLLADAEIARVVYEVFSTLGFTDFVIRLNSRKALNLILDTIKAKKSSRVDIIRVIDKMDKIGLQGVQKELQKNLLTKKQVEQLVNLALSDQARNNIEQLPAGPAKKELQQLLNYCQELGIPNEALALDLTLARGLDYYTGTIYEVMSSDEKLGSVCGGGRYDNLTSMFSEKAFPGVGVAFGLDRMMVWLEEHNKLNDVSSQSEVLVLQFSDNLDANIDTLNKLQAAGIASELYLEPAKLNKQFKFADKKQIPWVIVQGSDEVKKKKVMLRNMRTGEQKLLTLKKALSVISKQ